MFWVWFFVVAILPGLVVFGGTSLYDMPKIKRQRSLENIARLERELFPEIQEAEEPAVSRAPAVEKSVRVFDNGDLAIQFKWSRQSSSDFDYYYPPTYGRTWEKTPKGYVVQTPKGKDANL